MSDFDQTPSGIPVQAVYGPDRRSRRPGEFPFTRGNFADGYRGRLWTIRQYSGFGTPEESNARYRYLLGQGGTGLSVALDLPTQCGYDSDHPDVDEEVGRVGVAIDTLADAEILFDRIPLDQISTSFTINGTAAILLAFYVAAAEKQRVPRAQAPRHHPERHPEGVRDPRHLDLAAAPSLRLIADTIEFCASEVPRFNAISVAGAHFRDAGANAAQEMAFTLADGITYCDEVLGRGPDDHRRVRASGLVLLLHPRRLLRGDRQVPGRPEAVGHASSASGSARTTTGPACSGSAASPAAPRCIAPQAQNNIVRVAYEALASVLGGVQSMFTAAWDEPFAIPTEDSATLALRTQQVLAYETGVARVADPLGGSYYVEALTDEMEARSSRSWTTSNGAAGWSRAIEEGYLQSLIAEEAHRVAPAIEPGERVVVGVNRFDRRRAPPDLGDYELDEKGRTVSSSGWRRSSAALGVRRAGHARRPLRGAQDGEQSDAALIDCAKAYCTVGEMVEVLKDSRGEFQQPVVF